jgi:NitT/TauT family transport system ATP-binding protein
MRSAIVFQEPRLLPWFTVSQNIRLSQLLKKQKIDSEDFKNILNKVNLGSAENLFPSQISGGMKMRVSLARALLSKPNLLFLDEPLSAVDENNRHKLQELIRKIHNDESLTTVFITHSLSEAVFLANRIIMLNSQGMKVFDQSVPLPKDRTLELRSSELLSKTILNFQKPFQELIL